CRSPMMVLEHALVEVDHCPECQGVWLDGGELELLLGEQRAAAAYLKGGKPISSGERPRKCPIGRGKKNKETTQGPEPFTYDVCNRNDGMWFDQGELQAFLKYASEAKGLEPRVSQWLHDLFVPPGSE